MQGGRQPPLPDILPPQEAREAVEKEGDKVRSKGIWDDQSEAEVAEPSQKARDPDKATLLPRAFRDNDPSGNVDRFPLNALGI